jgi:hypothetical protein
MPNIAFTLAGAILPKIAYVDGNGVNQTLTFRFPPTNVSPITPVPQRTDNVAGDGTMWTISQYVEAYLQFDVLALIGDDLTNWMNFLTAAVNGQVMQFYPDSTKTDNYTVRMQVGTSTSSSGTNVPSGNPALKRVAPGRFKASLVLRYETPADAATVFAKLNP